MANHPEKHAIGNTQCTVATILAIIQQEDKAILILFLGLRIFFLVHRVGRWNNNNNCRYFWVCQLSMHYAWCTSGYMHGTVLIFKLYLIIHAHLVLVIL